MNATSQQIIDLFEQHVIRDGYDKANLDAIARELKISKKTIYVHFRNKRDIYAQVVARQALREKRRMASAVSVLPTHTARVEASVRMMLEMARTHIAETDEAEWLREYVIAADSFRKASGDLLRELVQAGIDAGEFRTGDAQLVEKMVSAMVIEYLLIVNADPAYDHDAELLERIVAFVK